MKRYVSIIIAHLFYFKREILKYFEVGVLAPTLPNKDRHTDKSGEADKNRK